ncbi:hypothetical protein EST38_g9007 [Candolleomyces aberdarensis]|uniref:Uncharacterized protein n=1 Tax=Candolleomyces aberdarensis TaxID=2316362 RepID=A0A4Q2DDC0_9AGAR|nr:hypothetical protein EST38_g9007 [Candolleomyces aberdarensis]
MARTKRASQLSGGSKPKATSPEYVPDDYEVVESERPPPNTQLPSPGTPTPTPTSGKRRVREDANPTPTPPAKKRIKNAQIVADSDEEDDGSSSTARSVSDGTDAADADVEDDDLETPKASKTMGKKKAMNLKTQLGGRLGISDVEESVEAAPPASFVTLPSSAFTLDNKAEWADSSVDNNGKTIIARSADDPLLAHKSILDPYMLKHGHYKNLPNANKLQLSGTSERHGLEFTNGTLQSVVPGLSMATWECFGINKEYVASLHRFRRQGNFVNASTVDVTELAFKEAWSNGGPGTAYIASDKADGRPIVFLMVGGIMESFLVAGRNVGFEGRAPWARGILILGHRFEHERWSCTFATLWHGEDIVVPVQRRHITMQTRNRPNSSNSATPSAPSTPDGSKKIGKMELKPYLSPAKPRYGANKTYIDWDEDVPIYDGRDKAFDPNDIVGSLARLPKYPTTNGEIPEGTGVVVGYCAATSKFMSLWKLTFNVMWIVVIAD